MVVTGRDESGQWVMWRIGRRRLAWKPGLLLFELLELAQGPLVPIAVVPLGLYLLNWVAAFLATAVVWPYRAVVDRWPVVAYVMDPVAGDNRLRRQDGLERAGADALARQWAEEIRRHGQPQPGQIYHDLA